MSHLTIHEIIFYILLPGIEARGFIFGPPIALAIGAKFVPLRKPKKLPGNFNPTTVISLHAYFHLFQASKWRGFINASLLLCISCPLVMSYLFFVISPPPLSLLQFTLSMKSFDKLHVHCILNLKELSSFAKNIFLCWSSCTMMQVEFLCRFFGPLRCLSAYRMFPWFTILGARLLA